MKTTLLLLLFLFLLRINHAQEFSSDFKIQQIGKNVKDFPDTFNLSTPLASFITINYMCINGKDRLWRKLSAEVIKNSLPLNTTPDSYVSEELKQIYLNTSIKEVISYKDSVAGIICNPREGVFRIRWLVNEANKWVNRGEDDRESMKEAEKLFTDYAKENLMECRKTKYFSILPKDTTSFIRYISEKGQDPKDFVLQKLRKYKLVMYGEIHRRKVSWELLMNIAKDKIFPEVTGVVFFEMASDKQNLIDKFFKKDTLDNQLLLDAFRGYQIAGWIDKGMFDFITCIWQINKGLPATKKIKVIAADTPRPFQTFNSREDMDKSDAQYNRDEFMANKVLEYFQGKTDKRNSLFVVGTGHVYKTGNSAGNILNKEFSKDLYTIFQHSPSVDEHSGKYKRIRGGVFDYAFFKSGDKPIAFELEGSPFGREPFDGLYYNGSATYQDNYNGYIFLGSLDKEPNGEMLLDQFNEAFIAEIDRRYKLLGSSLKESWGLKDTTKDALIEKLNQEHKKTRWEGMIEPLH